MASAQEPHVAAGRGVRQAALVGPVGIRVVRAADGQRIGVEQAVMVVPGRLCRLGLIDPS